MIFFYHLLSFIGKTNHFIEHYRAVPFNIFVKKPYPAKTNNPASRDKGMTLCHELRGSLVLNNVNSIAYNIKVKYTLSPITNTDEMLHKTVCSPSIRCFTA